MTVSIARRHVTILVAGVLLFSGTRGAFAASPSIGALQAILKDRCAVLAQMERQLAEPLPLDDMNDTFVLEFNSFFQHVDAVENFSDVGLSVAEIQQIIGIFERMGRCNDSIAKLYEEWLAKLLKAEGSSGTVASRAEIKRHERDQAAAKLREVIARLKAKAK